MYYAHTHTTDSIEYIYSQTLKKNPITAQKRPPDMLSSDLSYVL